LRERTGFSLHREGSSSTVVARHGAQTTIEIPRTKNMVKLRPKHGAEKWSKRHSKMNEEKSATAEQVLRELIPRTGIQRQCVCSMIMPIKTNGQNIFEKVVQIDIDISHRERR